MSPDNMRPPPPPRRLRAPTWPPHPHEPLGTPPETRGAPRAPVGVGPRHGPHTPNGRAGRPGKPGAPLDLPSASGPDMAPTPPMAARGAPGNPGRPPSPGPRRAPTWPPPPPRAPAPPAAPRRCPSPPRDPRPAAPSKPPSEDAPRGDLHDNRVQLGNRGVARVLWVLPVEQRPDLAEARSPRVERCASLHHHSLDVRPVVGVEVDRHRHLRVRREVQRLAAVVAGGEVDLAVGD